MRDAGLTVVEAASAVGLTAGLVDRVGPAGLLAFPPLLFFFWHSLGRHPEVREKVPWMAEHPEDDWLEDAYASRLRRTDISTLGVRYDVDPAWLAGELDAYPGPFPELSRFASTCRT